MSGVVCPQCDAQFSVVWFNSLDTQGGPHFCPFCGSVIDEAYDEAAKVVRDA